MMLLKNHGTVFDIHIKITDGNEPVNDHITHLRKHPQCVKNESFDENKQSGPPFPAQQVWRSAYHVPSVYPSKEASDYPFLPIPAMFLHQF